MADTGVKAPTAAESVGEAPWNDANCGWVNPENIYGAGEAKVVHASFDSPDQTYVLKAYTFDFSAIPDGATITGVQVVINARYAVSAVSLDLCQLLDTSRAKVGTNMYSTPQALTTSAANYTIGDSTNLWGNALTPAWVKDANFGVAIGAVAGGANSDVFIDSVTMQVWYTVPVSYTLPSAAGSFSEAGTAVALKATRRMVAGTASYSEVGTAVGLRRAFTLVAGTAAFSLAGTAVALKATRRMVAGTASYAMTGTAALLYRKFTLAAAGATYAMTGTAAAMRATRLLPAATVAFAMTGTVVAMKATRILLAAVESYAMTGTAVAMRATRTLPAAAGSFALTGTDAALVRASKLIAEAGGFSLVGQDVELTYVPVGVFYSLAADPGAFSLDGDDALLVATRLLASGAGAFSLTGQDVELTYEVPPQNYSMVAGSEAFLMSGKEVQFHLRGRHRGRATDVWVALPPTKHTIVGSPSHPYRRRIGESMWWVR